MFPTEPKELLKLFAPAIAVSVLFIFICILVVSITPKTNEILRPSNVHHVDELLKQIQKSHLLSVQDSNPITALIHSTDALRTYKILKHTILSNLSNDDIYKLTSTDVSKLYRYLEKTQRDCLKTLQTFTPDLPLISSL